MENIPFLIARRRNEQRRHGGRWIVQFGRAAELDPATIHLVEAEVAIPRERQRRMLVDDGLRASTVCRTPRLSLEEASRIWDAAVSGNPSEEVVCELRHHPDFPVRVQVGLLLSRLKSLLDYDGDTVGITTLDLGKGLFVDMFSDSGTTACEIDRWGGW